MSNDTFMKSNAALDKAVTESTNFEEMREKMLATLANQGSIVRSRTDAYDVRVIARPEPDASLPAASAYKFEKEVRFAESTGKRALVIRANTLEELAALEAQVTR